MHQSLQRRHVREKRVFYPLHVQAVNKLEKLMEPKLSRNEFLWRNKLHHKIWSKVGSYTQVGVGNLFSDFARDLKLWRWEMVRMTGDEYLARCESLSREEQQ